MPGLDLTPGRDQPLLNQLVSLLASLDSKSTDALIDLAQGRLFTAGGSVSLGSGATGSMRIANPAGSDKIVTVQSFTLATTQVAEAQFWVDATHASGTAKAAFNNNRASAVTPVAQTTQAATARTGGTQLSPVYLLPSSIPITQQFPLILAPGQSVIVQATTPGGLGSSMTFYAAVTWSEDPI